MFAISLYLSYKIFDIQVLKNSKGHCYILEMTLLMFVKCFLTGFYLLCQCKPLNPESNTGVSRTYLVSAEMSQCSFSFSSI